MADTNLNGFIEAVNAEVDKKIEDILAEAEERRTEILEKAENEALNDAYTRIRASVTEARTKSRMNISKAEQESRIKILTYREELVKKIFDDVEAKVAAFVQTPEYEQYLIKLLTNEQIEESTVIYLKPDDMKYENVLKNSAGVSCKFEEDTAIVYGGLSIYNEDSALLVNKTIDNMLEEQKKDFGSNYKLA